MSIFRRGINVVLQSPDPQDLICECFIGIASPNPALISVVSAGGGQADSYARQTGSALSRALRSASGAVTTVPPPCSKSKSQGPLRCKANDEPTCQCVLVVMLDGSPITGVQKADLKQWASLMQLDRRYKVIPCVPVSLKSRLTSLLPSELSLTQSYDWTSKPEEVVPFVLSAAGLTAQDHRVFISYRQSEGQIFADQIFDALNRRNFDVYLDRFRMDPGINFQERIDEELCLKSMVLLLETKTIDQSKWVAHEIAYASQHRLGILAVQLPDGVARREVGNRRRIRLPASAFKADGELEDLWLERVCNRVAIAHSIAMMRRRHQLQQAMRNCLLKEGVRNQRVTLDGMLEAYSKQGILSTLWLTPRPAEVGDFHKIEAKSSSSTRCAIVSPGARLPGRRQDDIHWLSSISKVRFFDESEMVMLARQISRGAL